MKLSEFKTALEQMDSTVSFVLPDGSAVAPHYHVTEIGEITKRFVDCGGTYREEAKISIQLWQAQDYDHRLTPEKLSKIISMSISNLDLQDAEVEVEYQGATTIERYGVKLSAGKFALLPLHTACLAMEACDTADRVAVSLQTIVSSASTSCCSSEGNCC